jgi:UDP-N-acetylmuramyl tripeptide synthase
MPQVLREKLRECDVPESSITVIPGRTDAINAALAMARPGDWVVVFVSAVDPTVIAVGDKLSRLAAASEFRI